MNFLKKTALTALCTLTSLSSILTVTGCSSSSSSEDDTNYAGVLTVEDFAKLRKMIQIFSTGSVFLVPETLITPSDQVTTRTEVFGNIVAESSEGTSDPVQVVFTYITSGNVTSDEPPTNAILEVVFSSISGQNNDAIVNALGLREVGAGNVLSGLVFYFDFTSNTVNIHASGSNGLVVQPGDGTSGENTDYQELLYDKGYAIRQNSF